MPPDRDITVLLPRLLADVKRPGDFYGTGELPLPVLRLAVDGVGILGLPLPPMQVEALARVATPAPYGRGGDTLVDPTVRRCGQIGASAVDASDPRWQALVDTVVGRAAAALGVEGGATASLYRDGFFREHRDTEKVPARVNDTAPLRRFLLEVIGAGAFDGSETEAIVAALGRLQESDATAIVAAIARGRATARFAPVRPPVARRRERATRSLAAPRCPGGPRRAADGRRDLIERGRRKGESSGRPGRSDSRDRPLGRPRFRSRACAGGSGQPGALAIRWRDHPRRSGIAAQRQSGPSRRHRRASRGLSRASLSPHRAVPGPARRCGAIDRWAHLRLRNCSALRSFLADPVATTWTLKAAAPQRVHVEESIRRAGCDVDFRTERRGSPHTLVCDKNQASYQARVRQRAADRHHLAQIEPS